MVWLLCPVYIFVFDKLNAPSVDYVKLTMMKANYHKDRPAGMSLEPKRHLHASISFATHGDDPVKDLAGESYFKAFLSSAMLLDINMPVIESKTFGVLQEVKQPGLAASEFLDAVDPKRIVPNHAALVR
jgi:hypothetical protein